MVVNVRLMKRSVLLLLFCLLSLPEYIVAAPVSSSIPLDSWIYPAIDKLSGLGLVQSSLQGTRPFTRHEAARLTREALDNADLVPHPPVVIEILRRLQSELQDALKDKEQGRSYSYFHPVREIRLEYLHREGQDSRIASRPPGGANDQIGARQFALAPNNFGLDYVEGHNGQLFLETEARLGGFFLLNWQPHVLIDEERDASLRTRHGTAILGLGPFQLSVGRESLWWGPGRHGSLILSNNAKPLDMVRVTNPTPLLLPWFFKYLGPFQFDVLWSRLEAERVISEPYLAGMRINFKPRPWLELGASRTVMFGGEGRPKVRLSDFLTILGGKNLEGGEDTSNQLASLDARIKFPFLAGTELYGELGGEDEAGGFISHKSWIVGVYLPKIEPTGRAAIRFEYADLTHESKIAPIWYRHGIYRSGYTYKGKVLGHHIGGAARSYFSELEYLFPGGWTLRGSFDYQERGTDQLVQEIHRIPSLEAEAYFPGNIRLCLAYGYDSVRNSEFLSGSRRSDHLLKVGVSKSW